MTGQVRRAQSATSPTSRRGRAGTTTSWATRTTCRFYGATFDDPVVRDRKAETGLTGVAKQLDEIVETLP